VVFLWSFCGTGWLPRKAVRKVSAVSYHFPQRQRFRGGGNLQRAFLLLGWWGPEQRRFSPAQTTEALSLFWGVPGVGACNACWGSRAFTSRGTPFANLFKKNRLQSQSGTWPQRGGFLSACGGWQLEGAAFRAFSGGSAGYSLDLDSTVVRAATGESRVGGWAAGEPTQAFGGPRSSASWGR